MTSLFTQFVARGIQVPVIDPRVETHVDALVAVTPDDRPATSADDANDAAAPLQASTAASRVSVDGGTTSPT